jgi:hypothetical protein
MRDALIGRTLRALRHHRGWRQGGLALRARVARSVLADLEAGRIGTLRWTRCGVPLRPAAAGWISSCELLAAISRGCWMRITPAYSLHGPSSSLPTDGT